MGEYCTFKKCCFCINLKAGCYLIGAYALLSNSITAVMQATSQFSPWTEMSLSSFYLLVILSIINIGFNIVLLYAIKKNRKDLIRIILMYRIVIQVVEAVAISVYCWLGFGFILVPFFLIHFLSLYCILVIRSYYLTMSPLGRAPPPRAPPPRAPKVATPSPALSPKSSPPPQPSPQPPPQPSPQPPSPQSPQPPPPRSDLEPNE